MKPKAVIFDVDSTLVDVSPLRELALASVESQDFDEYHRQSIYMKPIDWVVEAAHEAARAGFIILVVTARQERYRDLTEYWLSLHDIHYDLLAMRVDGDIREDAVIKEVLYENLALRFDVVKAYEDRESVAALWRRKGLSVVMVP